MAYTLPTGSTKYVDAATVANTASSTPALVPLSSLTSPVIFYVSCNQTHGITMGTVSQSTTTVAELDIDTDYTRTSVATTATYGTNKYTFWPSAGGYAWLIVTNKSGSADATVSVWARQV